MAWYDMFKLWKMVTTQDPFSRRNRLRDIEGSGIAQADAIPDLRADGSYWSGGSGVIKLRDSSDFIDLSSVTNRQSRYKEYERLRMVSEIETAITVFADESCVVGDTKVATPFGYTSIKELAESKDKDDKFLVYCYDFFRQDYTLGWAFHPRKVKKALTVRIVLENGTDFSCTRDHKVLLRNEMWIEAGKLQSGDDLMPFYRVKPQANKLKSQQFPRVLTLKDGWKHERAFIDEWRSGSKTADGHKLYKIHRCIAAGLNTKQIAGLMGVAWPTIDEYLNNHGCTYRELKSLHKRYPDRRRVVSVLDNGEQDVYDLSVQEHENFATDTTIFHNCQVGENGHLFDVIVKNQDIKEELDFLFFHPKMLNMDRKMWNIAKNLFMFGDHFFELVIDPEEPKAGVLKVQTMPADSVYRIETIKGKLLEFQQSKDGPDYQSLARVEVTKATSADLAQATAIRFVPESVVHFKIGDDRRTFYPYGVSLIEPARGPAHQLRLMEDSMLVYRLSRAPERRVFYIDVGQLPPFKAEMLIERLKDQLRKRKTFNKSGDPGTGGASPVEERWTAQSQDEDFWIPIRPNANTRVETLPGACLALDTKIPLLDGRELELRQIIGEFNDGKRLWAYSCDPITGKVAPGLISWAGVTRKNARVVKVTLDNGESIICTPDHKFPVQTKGKTQAKDLKAGDSLFPFNTRLKDLHWNRKSKYLQIYDSESRDWMFAHRMVARTVKGTKFENVLVHNEGYKNLVKDVIHHINYNHFDNTPDNLAWMNWDDHALLHRDNQEITNANISKALKKHHENLSDDKKEEIYSRLSEMSVIGSNALNEKLKDKGYREEFIKKQKEGWVKAKEEKKELHKARGQKISKRNCEYWSNPENKKKAFDKQTIFYPQEVFNFIMERLKANDTAEQIAKRIDVGVLREANKHIVRESVSFDISVDHIKKAVKQYGYKSIRDARNSVGGVEVKSGRPKREYSKEMMDKFMGLLEHKDIKEICDELGLSRNSIYKMIKYFGYKNLGHVRRERANFNHKVVSVEWLDERMDTGTLTIDAKHEIHPYHTFAVSACVFTTNSNLGEIDDALYFRNKLFISLNFPKNYMAQEDSQVTKVTLSSIDVKFARLVERLQQSMADGMLEIGIRHLELRGFPPEMYEDLHVRFTPPSHYREISENEVIAERFNRALAVKGSMIFADLDILTKILKIPIEEAKEIVARATVQKLQELKLQVMAQNPQLMGIAMPGKANMEMGTEAGGPNPMLTGAEVPGATPPGQPTAGAEAAGTQLPPPAGANPPVGKDAQDTYGQPPKAESKPLPEPTKKDIDAYDMSIDDFSKGIDEEELDGQELDDY